MSAKIMQSQFDFQGCLKEHGVGIRFTDGMSIAARWESIRAAITTFRLTDTPMRKGSTENYAAAFLRVTGLPLEPVRDNAA